MNECERCRELEAAIRQLNIDLDYYKTHYLKLFNDQEQTIQKLRKQLWRYEGGESQLRF